MASFPFVHQVIDAVDTKNQPLLLERLFEQQLDLLIVRNALPTEALRQTLSSLDNFSITDDVPWTPQQFANPHRHQMMLIGESLTPNVSAPTGPDLQRYFEKARWIESFVQNQTVPFFRNLEQIFQSIGAQNPSVAQDNIGNRYTPGTFRKLPVGCSIPLHVGNYFFDTGGYRILRESLDTRLQLSYFYTLRPAVEGGELAVYSTKWSDPNIPWLEDHGIWDGETIMRNAAVRYFKPGAGDLLIFNGGHFFHRVTEIKGTASRWTLGGFLAKDTHGQVVYWN
ncbi:MAG: hypothetical protein VX278_17740 [Myxococcota bacterium]|nr:hypothetical protein [Myxococcota bacterium]